MLTNKNFVIIITCSGGLVGLLNGLLSTFTQISCSAGYSNEFSGVCVTILNFCGVAGGISASFLFRRTGLVEEQAKVTYAIGALISMPLLYVLLEPDLEWALATLCAM